MSSAIDVKYMQSDLNTLGSQIYAMESIKDNPKWFIQLNLLEQGMFDIQLDLMRQYYSILNFRILDLKQRLNIGEENAQ